MAVLERGAGRPYTLFAPGGEGDHLELRMTYADQVAGTKVGFAYGTSGHGETSGIRREADRDACEARAIAVDRRATQAIGFSRGARAIVGVLAADPVLFGRVALVLPPGGRAAGDYATWLGSLTDQARGALTTEVLVVGHRGDQGHPARVAEAWAEWLGARLELLSSRAVRTDRERVGSLLAEFLS